MSPCLDIRGRDQGSLFERASAGLVNRVREPFVFDPSRAFVSAASPFRPVEYACHGCCHPDCPQCAWADHSLLGITSDGRPRREAHR